MAQNLDGAFAGGQEIVPLPRPGVPIAGALPAPNQVSDASSDEELPISPPGPQPKPRSGSRPRPRSRRGNSVANGGIAVGAGVPVSAGPAAAGRGYFVTDQGPARPTRGSREETEEDYYRSDFGRHPDTVRPAGRISARPPRAYLNHPAYEDLDSPGKTVVEETKSPREFYTHAGGKQRQPLYDEEQGYGHGTGGPAGPTGAFFSRISRDGGTLGAGERINWRDLSQEERAEVLRIPWTQWMNSNFKNHFVATVGEFIGTTMFLFFAFAGAEVANIQGRVSGDPSRFNLGIVFYTSAAFGFSLMVNVWIFFRISGGLFNPAVTLAMWLVRAITAARALCLFLAQMSGGIIASVMVRYLFPENFSVRTKIDSSVSIAQGIFIEAILTAELVFTIFMLAKEKHRATFMAPFGIGMALFIGHLVAVHFTGASMNPARSFGPCVVSTTFESEHWIYWVGPLIGALIAVVFYRFIKMLEYEMANPGADGDPENDPTQNPEKRAEIQLSRRFARPKLDS